MMDQVDVTRQTVRTLLASDGWIPVAANMHWELWYKNLYQVELWKDTSEVRVREEEDLPKTVFVLPEDFTKICGWIKHHS